MAEFWESLLTLSTLVEVAAVLGGLLYLLLAVRQNVWCWLWGGLGALFSFYVAVTAQLYVFAVENVYYLWASAYGYYLWRRGEEGGKQKAITGASLSFHLWAILLVGALSLGVAALLQRFTDQAAAQLDCLTTGFAFWATYLLAKKKLESWLYWVVVDAAFTALCLLRGLHVYAGLYLFYTVWAGYAYFKWRRQMLLA